MVRNLIILSKSVPANRFDSIRYSTSKYREFKKGLITMFDYPADKNSFSVFSNKELSLGLELVKHPRFNGRENYLTKFPFTTVSIKTIKYRGIAVVHSEKCFAEYAIVDCVQYTIRVQYCYGLIVSCYY